MKRIIASNQSGLSLAECPAPPDHEAHEWRASHLPELKSEEWMWFFCEGRPTPVAVEFASRSEADFAEFLRKLIRGAAA